MPFVLMSSVIAAMGHSTAIVRYSAIGLLVAGATLFVVGELGQPLLVGLGLVMNTLVVGVLCTMHVRREVHFPLRALTRIVDDVRSALVTRRSRS
jgi:O-antigen/teichoic acid export membrane protein